MRLEVTLFVVILTGCNNVAGIADFHTGELDAGNDGGDAAASDDGTAPNTDAAINDANAAADADVPPECAGGEIGLRITVAATSTSFTGVTDDSNGIAVKAGGTAYSHCFASGTQIQLIAQPDMSNVIHDWGAAPCAAGRRCAFTLTQALAMDVDL